MSIKTRLYWLIVNISLWSSSAAEASFIDITSMTSHQFCEIKLPPANFEALTKESTFVDKTGLIELFFNTSQKVFYTGPRKIGKSVNFNMLKRFAEIEVDKETGIRLKKEDSSNYRLFTDPSLNLYISKRQDIIKEHLAEHPVILLDMGYRIYNHTTEQEMFDGMSTVISNTFKEFEWLYNIYVKNQSLQKDAFKEEKIQIMRKALDKKLTTDEMHWCIFHLSEALHLHFNKSVVILFDEYDRTYENMTFDIGPDVRKINEMVGNLMYYAFKYYPACDYSSHVFAIGRESLQCYMCITNYVMDALKEYLFLHNHPYAPYFGLTGEEVNKLLDDHKISQQQRDIMERDYYFDYVIKDTTTKMYNPFLVTSFIKYQKIKSQTT